MQVYGQELPECSVTHETEKDEFVFNRGLLLKTEAQNTKLKFANIRILSKA